MGNGGTILHTANGGTTWTGQTSGTTQTLFGVEFLANAPATAVPEPGTITMLGIGIASLAGYCWRRRKAAVPS